MLIISCNVEPLTSQVYKVKLGLQGYNITFFLFLLENIDRYNKERWYPLFMFLAKIRKNVSKLAFYICENRRRSASP